MKDKEPDPDVIMKRIEEALSRRSREPFGKILAAFVASAPEAKDLEEYAKKFPDRHAQAAAIWGRLMGYSEKVEHTHEHDIWIKIGNMSDVELQLRLDRLLNKVQPNIIEGEIVEEKQKVLIENPPGDK